MPKTIPATPWEMEHHPHRGAEAHGYISVNDANGNPIFDTSNASYKLAMQMDEGEGEQKWYEQGLEPALQLAAAAPLLRKQLKEAVGVLAAIHDAENGKTRADQGIVTLAGRACDEARAALAAAGDAQAGPSDLEKAVLDLTCAACDNQIRWKLHTWQECAVCAPVRRALAGEPL